MRHSGGQQGRQQFAVRGSCQGMWRGLLASGFPAQVCTNQPTAHHAMLRSPLLQCGFKDGSDRLHLRLPEEVAHRIAPASPLASWLQAGGGGLSQDADSEIVVVVSPQPGCHILLACTPLSTARPPSACLQLEGTAA